MHLWTASTPGRMPDSSYRSDTRICMSVIVPEDLTAEFETCNPIGHDIWMCSNQIMHSLHGDAGLLCRGHL